MATVCQTRGMSLAQDETDAVAVRRLDFLPIALTFLRTLRVAEIIDAAVPPPQSGPQSTLAKALGLPPPAPPPSVGRCAEAMILNVLEGRVALCQMEDWLRGLATESLWGSEVDPAQFTDDRLAAALDALFQAGTEALYTQIVTELVGAFDVNCTRLHFDTTSLQTSGAHAVPDGLPGPRAVHGYSKDHRPDLLQWVFGLTVQAEGLPIVSTLQDGNTSDSLVHRSHLELLAARRLDPSDTTFIGDSKSCNAESLGLLRSVGFHITTLLPQTFAQREQRIEEALQQPEAAWVELARRPGDTRHDPERVWRGCVLPCVMDLRWPDPEGEGTPFQARFGALVIHSSELSLTHERSARDRRERQQSKLQRTLERSHKAHYACEADAAAAAQALLREVAVTGLTLCASVFGDTLAPRRPGRGRPRKGETLSPQSVYRFRITIEQDLQAQRVEAQRHGLFVLLTSRPIDSAYPADRVLADYQGQEVVEAGFRWIKSPGQVAPILLHTPARIEALSFLFTVTLLLYRLLQLQMRRALAQTEQTLPGPNRVPTRRPTTQTLMRLFAEVYLVRIPAENGFRLHLVGWKPVHTQVLALLGLPPDLYRDPEKFNRPPRVPAK